MAKKKQKSAEELFGTAVSDRFSSADRDGEYHFTWLDENGKPIKEKKPKKKK